MEILHPQGQKPLDLPLNRTIVGWKFMIWLRNITTNTDALNRTIVGWKPSRAPGRQARATSLNRTIVGWKAEGWAQATWEDSELESRLRGAGPGLPSAAPTAARDKHAD